MLVVNAVGKMAGVVATVLPMIATLAGAKGLLGLLNVSKALWVSLATNPIGAIILALTSLATAIAVVNANWDQLKATFTSWEGIKDVASWVSSLTAPAGFEEREEQDRVNKLVERNRAAAAARGPAVPTAGAAGANGAVRVDVHVHDKEGKASVKSEAKGRLIHTLNTGFGLAAANG
jgi:hypothetical protein